MCSVAAHWLPHGSAVYTERTELTNIAPPAPDRIRRTKTLSDLLTLWFSGADYFHDFVLFNMIFLGVRVTAFKVNILSVTVIQQKSLFTFTKTSHTLKHRHKI